VDYTTADGTATAGDDYTSISDTLTFEPGVSALNVDVPINDDTLEEEDETVVLVLSNVGGNASIGDNNPATLTILDDDAPVIDPMLVNDSPTVLGQVTTLTATVSGGGNVTCTWDLGAGTPTFTTGVDGAGRAVVTHTYPAVSVYTATVTASDGSSQSTAASTVVIVTPLGPITYTIYLPLAAHNSPPPTFPLFIGNAIPDRTTDEPGQVFYTTLARVPDDLPGGGHFYLSSQRDAVAQVSVDDALVVSVEGEQVFEHLFSTETTSPVPVVVELPRSVMEGLAGQTITVEYHDVYGVIVGASEMWLIWSPQ
jgi:hypothetical protein